MITLLFISKHFTAFTVSKIGKPEENRQFRDLTIDRRTIKKM